MSKNKIIVVAGPTASGKTELGVRISEKFNGEVISADSMQIYTGMDIATAKPVPDEMRNIKHHLIDYVSPSSSFSVSDFCRDARSAAESIINAGKLPVIVGGTGLYIDSFVNNTTFLDNASDPAVRSELKERLENEGIDVLYDELLSVCPDYEKTLHKNNTVRVLRALELYECTGKTIFEQNEQSHNTESDYEPIYIGIDFKERKNLYDRINRRVDNMLSRGLVEEAEKFYSEVFSQTSANAIGYKELKPYLDGTASLEDCVEKLKFETRHYAKRQLTWFRRNKNFNWFFADSYDSSDDMFSDVSKIIKEFIGGDIDEK